MSDDLRFVGYRGGAPTNLIRHHVRGEKGFQAHDSAISVHEPYVIAMEEDEPRVWVDVESAASGNESIPGSALMIDLSTSPLQNLLHTRMWTDTANLGYYAKQELEGNCIPDECEEQLQPFLKMVLSGEAVKADTLSAERMGLLEVFEEQGLLYVDPSDNVRATSRGQPNTTRPPATHPLPPTQPTKSLTHPSTHQAPAHLPPSHCRPPATHPRPPTQPNKSPMQASGD